MPNSGETPTMAGEGVGRHPTERAITSKIKDSFPNLGPKKRGDKARRGMKNRCRRPAVSSSAAVLTVPDDRDVTNLRMPALFRSVSVSLSIFAFLPLDPLALQRRPFLPSSASLKPYSRKFVTGCRRTHPPPFVGRRSTTGPLGGGRIFPTLER